MTFYWWSHWFWITVMSNLIFCPLIVVVHTYPSQDSSQEYNLHQTENARKLVTKLYQASTTTWVTESSIVARTTTAEKTRLQSVTMSETSVTVPPHSSSQSITEEGVSGPTKYNGNHDGFEDYYYEQDDETDTDTETETKQIDLEEVEDEMERKDQRKPDYVTDEQENDIKRSAEHFSKSSEAESKIMELKPTELNPTSSSTSSSPKEEQNNYTNFTEKISISTNATTISTSPLTNVSTIQISDSDTAAALFASASASSSVSTSASSSPVLSTLTTNNNNATVLPRAPPATPKIVKTHSPLDWLNSMADVAVSPPTARVTTDINDDRFPFTLENVHKSEDLRREENEPRTRKSKGLSADYKQGYASINYSSESKNLLTRSASTTVNDDDIEESNISSEALSVQRAYFMDVGAISAICFTVFGICCTVGTIGIVLYRRRFLNKPQALSEPDSSVYIDDSTMRDNSDEMYSLDNDSFLNSLEAMTIQNYWTDTVKHTKL